jgi:cytochrome c553
MRMTAWGSGWVVLVAMVGLTMAATASSHAQTFEELVHNCDQCHGKNGQPRDVTTPIIWGQNQGYLYIQLRDYKRGSRKDEFMSDVALDLDRNAMMALAEYYSQKPWPTLVQPPAPKDIAAIATRANGSIGCTGCHLDQYRGVGAGTAPRLAGQTREYLERTMVEFRSGDRANNPGMTDLMRAAEQGDVAALAQFLAGLY